MKVLYGVQATGNGHITRARVMAPALAEAEVEVDYLFSGRPADELFDMEPFGDFQVRRGLTFSMGDGGKVKMLDTLLKNNLWQLWQDVRMLDLSRYDLVISDFEPVTAWAARLQGKPSVGIAHQYAFLHPLPDGIYSRLLKPGIRLFAPVDQGVGVHWSAFDAPMVPPLIRPPAFASSFGQALILVYMPHETDEVLHGWFRNFPRYQFHVYSKRQQPTTRDNVRFFPLSREAFEQDLAACDGVISNCGFGLASETMQYGKKLLCKPMQGQAEQQSNARILDKLELATIVDELSESAITQWLSKPNPDPVCFPDVAGVLSRWVADGAKAPLKSVTDKLW